VRAGLDGDVVQIDVCDTGVGIASDRLEAIFDPFSKPRSAAHDHQPGLGLGLSLSRRLLELHGGTLRAFSEGPDRGATFIVRLPSTPSGASQQQLPRTGAMASRSVLVVDDNQDAAHGIAELLRRAGHRARVVHDGPGALAAAAEADFDVVLLDIGMPGMSGYEVCRRLRHSAHTSNARIVALTGWGSEADREEARKAGFDEHLTKPARWEDIERQL